MNNRLEKPWDFPALAAGAADGRRLTVAVLLAIAIAVVFWSQSRVPALNEKAQMGLRTNVSAIAFDVVLPVSASQPLPERIARSAVNWGYTNWKGMTFGLLFGAAALTILGGMRRRSFGRPWADTLLGAATGAPLGVCVNCATPIAHGLYAAGTRLETALAALISSPTLNVIVVTMAFTLLPWELAVIKLMGVVLLLAAIPSLARALAGDRLLAPGQAERLQATAAGMPAGTEAADISAPARASWASAIASTLNAYRRNLWYLVRTTLPLMLLAGLLGAAVVELLDPQSLPTTQAGWPVLAAVALVTVILPVPIAFDVIAASTLLTAGVTVSVVAVVLAGLGVYSIYPAMMLARYVRPRLAFGMGVSAVLMALLCGAAAEQYFAYRQAQDQTAIAIGLSSVAAQRLVVAGEECARLGTADSFKCLSDFVLASEGLVTADCGLLPAQFSPETCASLVTFARARSQALLADDPAACDGLADPGLRAGCRFTFTTTRAQERHDFGICADLPTAQRASCETQYVDKAIRFTLDRSACDEVPAGREYQTCLIKLQIYRLVLDKDLDGCTTLSLPAARRQCRLTVVREQVALDGDTRRCIVLAAEEDERSCRDTGIALHARDRQDITACDTLADPAGARDCRVSVVTARIEQRLNAATITRVETLLADADSARAGAGAQPPGPLPAALPTEWRTIYEDDALAVEAMPLRPRSVATPGGAVFQKIDGARLGLTDSWQFRATDLFDPFVIGRGVASGDLNDDPWPDLVLATGDGVRAYLNTGGHFAPIPLHAPALQGQQVFGVMIADFDNDGTGDILATTYGGDNFLLLAQDGDISRPRVQRLPGVGQLLTLSVGVADIDRNGLLDIVLGNWSSGTEKLFSPEFSDNAVLLGGADGFVVKTLEEPRGETLSVLLSDIDGDGATDLLLANDRLVPDMLYLGDGSGLLRRVTAADRLIPVTPVNTMSLEAGDFNNDGRMDLFSADMSFSPGGVTDYCAAVDAARRSACNEMVTVYRRGIQGGNVSACDSVASEATRHQCYQAMAVRAAAALKQPGRCDQVDAPGSALSRLCRHLARPVVHDPPIDLRDHLPQKQRNVLLFGTMGGFVEESTRAGVAASFWSWNARAADLDNDGWLDLYVGNGFQFGTNQREIHHNVAFRNRGDGTFARVEAAWGLDDPVNTPSYTYLDLDLDGDLDIVATGVLEGPRVYLNASGQEGNGLMVRLLDATGNRAGIGSLLRLRAGETVQQRELRLSGGFLSFDQPTAHFGLGQRAAADRLEIRWPNGESHHIETALPAGHLYRVRRKAGNQDAGAPPRSH